ncbi:hypothetical protein Lal_00049901 [Lupinus albus]|nr:hypothetical protein Lal_00049901 [Lupinus albus]
MSHSRGIVGSPYGMGHKRATMTIIMGSKNMKLESIVIVDQHVTVNMYSGPLHTAYHTLEIGFARNIGLMITHDFCVPLVPQRLLVVFLAHIRMVSSTQVKS